MTKPERRTDRDGGSTGYIIGIERVDSESGDSVEARYREIVAQRKARKSLREKLGVEKPFTPRTLREKILGVPDANDDEPKRGGR